MGNKTNGWFNVLILRNTHRQPLPIRGCWTELETVEKEREIEMWRGAVALYPQSEANIYTAGTNMDVQGFFIKSSIVSQVFAIAFNFLN